MWWDALKSGISSMQSANRNGIVDAVIMSTSLMVFVYEAVGPALVHEAPQRRNWCRAMMLMVGRAVVSSAPASSGNSVDAQYSRSTSSCGTYAGERGTFIPIVIHHCRSCRRGPRVSRCIGCAGFRLTLL